MADKRDMATEGLKDQLKGAAKQVEGRVRSTVGGATGDTGEQVKGKGQDWARPNRISIPSREWMRSSRGSETGSSG